MKWSGYDRCAPCSAEDLVCEFDYSTEWMDKMDAVSAEPMQERQFEMVIEMAEEAAKLLGDEVTPLLEYVRENQASFKAFLAKLKS